MVSGKDVYTPGLGLCKHEADFDEFTLCIFDTEILKKIFTLLKQKIVISLQFLGPHVCSIVGLGLAARSGTLSLMD